MKKHLLLYVVVVLFIFPKIYGQQSDYSLNLNEPLEFKHESLLLPTFLIASGAFGIRKGPIRDLSVEIRESLKPDGSKVTVDDYLPAVGIASAYGLEFAGYKGRYDWKNKTGVLLVSGLFMYSSVRITKNNISARRPSGRSVSTFPSGHTALTFMGAEFLHQEYGHRSIWFSIGGYSIATLTGFLRIYNDKHWFNDVLAGAGIGILSTKLGYWLYPMIKNIIFKDKNKVEYSSQSKKSYTIQFAPIVKNNELQLGAYIQF
ncbi:phosphatase PAP2 family protein [Nonlabens sp. SY33080]|uniref:phosphatase PAP2 family protein n=1 Tax=Nonlabens sp. SY33080 TaxID=2719911 RepID=UPI001428CDC9|nr:phosphatase PAP2 family protein [Nonlabens sp. SY33080]